MFPVFYELVKKAVPERICVFLFQKVKLCYACHPCVPFLYPREYWRGPVTHFEETSPCLELDCSCSWGVLGLFVILVHWIFKNSTHSRIGRLWLEVIQVQENSDLDMAMFAGDRRGMVFIIQWGEANTRLDYLSQPITRLIRGYVYILSKMFPWV